MNLITIILKAYSRVLCRDQTCSGGTSSNTANRTSGVLKSFVTRTVWNPVFFFFKYWTEGEGSSFWVYIALVAYRPHTADLARLNTLYTAAYLPSPPWLDLKERYLPLCEVVWISRCLPTRWNSSWTHLSWHGWVQWCSISIEKMKPRELREGQPALG